MVQRVSAGAVHSIRQFSMNSARVGRGMLKVFFRKCLMIRRVSSVVECFSSLRGWFVIILTGKGVQYIDIIVEVSIVMMVNFLHCVVTLLMLKEPLFKHAGDRVVESC